MKYGLLSGIFWALDTILLGIALGLVLPDDTFSKVLWLIPVAGAFLHDLFSALWLLCLTVVRRRVKQLTDALHTKHGLAVVMAALLGGPVGMTGYMLANQIHWSRIYRLHFSLLSCFWGAVSSHTS